MQIAVSLSGGSENLDRCHVGAGFAFLLDGATAVRAVDPGVGRYVDSLSRHLQLSLATGVNDPDLVSLVASSVAGVVQDLRLSRISTPTSTITVCRSYRDTWQILVLGDSPAVVLLKGGSQIVVTDPRLARTTEMFRRRYEARLVGGFGFDGAHRNLLAEMQEHQFNARNRDDGYWIAGEDPGAVRHSLQVTLNIADLDAVILCSDGAFDSAKETGNADWLAISHMSVIELEALLRELHASELVDPDGQRRPRAKRHDDKTVVILRP